MKKEIVVTIVLSCIMGLIPMLAWAQTNDTKMIAIPVRKFNDFVAISFNPTTGEKNFSGFAIQVFQEVMTLLPSYNNNYKFVPFAKEDGTMNGTFDDMLKAVYSKDYAGAVGEITILSSRTQWVDFTMPYLDSPIAMLVLKKEKPIIKVAGFSLIGITYAFVITTYVLSFIVAVIYVVRISKWARIGGREDNKPRDATMGALVHTRLLMTIFFLIIVILVASYILSQATPTTSQRGSGIVKNLTQLIRNGANVGYRQGSFIKDQLLQKGFPESKLISLNSEEEMVDKLSKGTSNGGVDAIVANAPHLKLLEAKYCDKFITVPMTNLHATGLGFAFQIDSELGKDVSKGILKIVDRGQLGKIQDRTIGSLEACQDDRNNDIDVASSFLSDDHKWILIVGGILVGLLTIVSFIFLF